MRRAILLVLGLVACGGEPPLESITVFAAASMARPLHDLSRSFQDAQRVEVRTELGGSMELARRVTDLGAIPDVLILADDRVIASLVPAHSDWYVRFATSRLVLAYTNRSRFADSLTAENWWQVVTRDGVTIGRADSALAPAGRHALSVLRRAAGYYREPQLSSRLLARSPASVVRSNASELAALLETGEVDYILDYESVAEQFRFQYVRLPADLAPPVLYGVTVPRNAPHARQAIAFVTHMLGPDGERLLRAASIDVLRLPVAVGRNVPAAVATLVRTTAADSTP